MNYLCILRFRVSSAYSDRSSVSGVATKIEFDKMKLQRFPGINIYKLNNCGYDSYTLLASVLFIWVIIFSRYFQHRCNSTMADMLFGNAMQKVTKVRLL